MKTKTSNISQNATAWRYIPLWALCLFSRHSVFLSPRRRKSQKEKAQVLPLMKGLGESQGSSGHCVEKEASAPFSNRQLILRWTNPLPTDITGR
jgi:hypothetical protein